VHAESAYPQNLVPRRPQRLVRSHAIQSVQEAADHRADDPADDPAHPCGYCDLGRRVTAAVRGLSRLGRRRWRRRLIGVSI
jgi:hypothetical protein